MFILCLLFLFILAKSQPIIYAYTAYPNYRISTVDTPPTCFDTNPDATQFYLCFNNTISVFSITSNTTLTKVNDFTPNPRPATGFNRLYFVQNWLLASVSTTEYPRFFNINNFTENMTTGFLEHITSSEVITSKNVWIYGNNQGNCFWINLTTYPSSPRNLIQFTSTSSTIFLSKSVDQNFIAILYGSLTKFDIFDCSTLKVVITITLPSTAVGVSTGYFSLNSSYLFIFPLNFNYFFVYSRSTNWSNYSTCTTGYSYVKRCFLHKQTETGVCVSTSNQTLFTVVLASNGTCVISKKFTFSSLNNLMVSQNNQVFALININFKVIDLYKIQSNCSTGTIFDTVTRNCVYCSPSCNICLNTTTCSDCMVNYAMVNGQCQACTSSQIYNSTAKTCIAISSICPLGKYYDVALAICVICKTNCAKCSSTTVCQYCINNYTLIAGACQICNSTQVYNLITKLCDTKINNNCSSADQIWNVVSGSCVVCLINCGKCMSTISCQYCAYSFTLVNGSCRACTSNELYNTTTKLCDDITNFCSGDTYFSISLLECVQCLPNCGKCLSTTSCQSCAVNYTFLNGLCHLCESNTLYNSTTKLCDDITNFCPGELFYSISLQKCVQCTLNCAKCKSTTSCQYCISNYSVLNEICQPCEANQFYNFTTKLCVDPANNCHQDEYFIASSLKCAQCLPNCGKCLSATTCEFCAFNYQFLNESCLPCGSDRLYNISTKICEDVRSFCSGDQFFSIPDLMCVQCLPNCGFCLSADICAQCTEEYTLTQNRTCSLKLEDNQQEQNDFSLAKTFSNVMIFTLKNEAVQGANKVPANRILLNCIFSFFSNFDHLWFYIYHKREYGEHAEIFLQSIRYLELQKWTSLSQSFLSDALNINWTNWKLKIDSKRNLTSWKYLDIERTSSSFAANTLQYFIISIPLIFVIFVAFRLLFYLTFKYKISILIREYSFKLFFVIMIMEGNLQPFSYYFFFDCLHLHHQNYIFRSLDIFTIFFFFLFIWYVGSWFLIIKVIQDDDAKHFFGNYHINIEGIMYSTFQGNLLNLSLGAVHIIEQNNYLKQLTILSSIESIYFILQIISIKKKNDDISSEMQRMAKYSCFSFEDQFNHHFQSGFVKQKYCKINIQQYSIINHNYLFMHLDLFDYVFSFGSILSFYVFYCSVINFISKKYYYCLELQIELNKNRIRLEVIQKPRNQITKKMYQG